MLQQLVTTTFTNFGCKTLDHLLDSQSQGLHITNSNQSPIRNCDRHNIVRIPSKVRSLQIPPPLLLIPFLANFFPCKYCSLWIPLLNCLDKSIPCKFTRMQIVGPFLEYSFPCNFHPLSLLIQFLANSAPPEKSCTPTF